MQAYEDTSAEALPHSAAYATELEGQEVEAMEEEPAQAEDPAAPAPADTDDDDDVVDVINEALNKLLAKAQEDIEAANAMVAKKREELEAAEADAEEKEERLDELREQAQALSEDEQWQGMYHRLRAWSREHGQCNPRRNWQSKIDAEEKALGNWSGKQRRDERQGKLNPFKKEALERIGFHFEPRQQGWEVFLGKLKEYISEHGKLPKHGVTTKDFEKTGLKNMVVRYRQLPRFLLGERKTKFKDENGQSIAKEISNASFTQERIDVLTEAGLDWMLSVEQVNRLKEEKGLIFPMPGPDDDARPGANGDLAGMEKHAWLTNYEALVEFKKRYGHSYVTEYNSSEEFGRWASEQRKKMALSKGGGKAIQDKMFNDYQAELLNEIDFLYLKPDIEWMENYERLSAFRRLFGTTAIPLKYASFEALHQWLDENKRLQNDVTSSTNKASYNNVLTKVFI